MYQKVKAYVKKWHMLQKEDSVIAGISGGADSVCLLFMLLKLQKELGFALMAVHVNHGIRGAEAERDEAYVKRLCRQWNVRLKVYRENVPAYAKEHGMTEEEAGRDIRRTCFCKVLKEWGGTKIALAHHENDNVETLLWNLCRGTGIRGLGGIAPVNDVWIRPLLCVKRREIESYLKKRGISYCTDTTNADRRYMRNRIRMDVIPYLEDCVNTESVSHMGKTMERMYELEQYILEEVGSIKRAVQAGRMVDGSFARQNIQRSRRHSGIMSYMRFYVRQQADAKTLKKCIYRCCGIYLQNRSAKGSICLTG